MKYSSKSQVIEAARAAGSKANSFKGAAKFILSKVEPILPDCHATKWNRGERQHKEYIESKYIARADKICKANDLWTRCDAEAEANKLNRLDASYAEASLYDAWPYKQSNSRWAGGEHTINVIIDMSPGVRSGSEKVWSSNGKWSGNNSFATIYANLRTLQLFPELMTPDGLAVIDAEQIGQREYRITWLEQGKGFTLKPIHGYLIRGYHVQAKDLESARKKAIKARKAAASELLAKRQYKIDLKRVFVGIEDSLKAGNCKAATNNVASQLREQFGDIGGIRADILLSIRDDSYARRAIAAASNRVHA